METIKFQKTMRVLLVEDNKDAREAIYDLLHNYFDTIVTASNGKEGLESFKKQDFDLIISDIKMPVMNGIEMIREIRMLNPSIAIIVLTAHQEFDYIFETINLSVDGYLLKPLDFTLFQRLIDRITKALYNVKKNKEYEAHLEELVKQKSQELLELVNRDPLTNLYNRRYFNEISSLLFNLSKREKSNLSTLMIDIDYFKAINDTYGHLTGDRVLKNIADNLLHIIRETDVAIRFGGEEFVILLPNTAIQGAKSIAQKICDTIAKEEVKTLNEDATVIKYTVSIGIAICDCENDSDIDNLIHRSDEALYRAKNAGRNQVVIYS